MTARRLVTGVVALGAQLVVPLSGFGQTTADSVWLLWSVSETRYITRGFPDPGLFGGEKRWTMLAAYPSYEHCQNGIPSKVEMEVRIRNNPERSLHDIQSTDNAVSSDRLVLVARNEAGGLSLNVRAEAMEVLGVPEERRVDRARSTTTWQCFPVAIDPRAYQ